MATINKNSQYFDAQTKPQMSMLRGTVGIQLKTNDSKLKEAAPELKGFDGLEKAFALLPFDTDKGVTWQRCNLRYEGSQADSRSGSVLDAHGAYISASRLDVGAIERYGVAFGLDTNCGTVWLQSKGDNWSALRRGTGPVPDGM